MNEVNKEHYSSSGSE